MTRKQERRTLVFALSFIACTVVAQAQPPRGQQPRLVLQALDTDHDGTVSSGEIMAAPHTLLALDRNGDGQITLDELQARPENAGASADDLVQQLMVFDKNSDGVLTADELPQRMQSLFTRGDANHDGKLTPDEIRALAARQAMPVGTAQPGRAAAMMRMDPLLNALDTDHDGTLSPPEIAAASQSLAALDKNGDGAITPDETRMRQQTPQERADHLLDEWDTNKDGRVSKAEAPDRMQKDFESIDKNGDGSLDKDELLQYFSAQANAQAGSPKEQRQ